MGIALTLALSIGCGKSDEQKAAEKAAEETKKAAEALAKAAEKTAASGTNGGPVGRRQGTRRIRRRDGRDGPGRQAGTSGQLPGLQTVLPECRAGSAREPTGERMTTPDVVLANRGRLHEGRLARSS